MGILLGLVGAAFLAELGARVFAPGPRALAPRRVEPEGFSPFRRTPEGLLVYAPKVRWAFVYDPAGDPSGALGESGRVEFATNALGLRGPERSLAKPAGALRVIALGDSFTFGEGVRYEESWPAVLERGLSEALAPRAVEVWNAGVQGYGTPEAFDLLALRLLAAEPDAVVLGFFLNDATDFERTIADFGAELAGTTLSPLGRASRLVEILERGRAAAQRRAALASSTRESFRGAGWERAKRAIRALRILSEQRGFRLLVLVFPMLWNLESRYPFEEEHRLVAAALDEAGVEHLDLLHELRGMQTRLLWVHDTDHHPSPRVHALAAERLLERLLAAPPGARR